MTTLYLAVNTAFSEEAKDKSHPGRGRQSRPKAVGIG